MTKKFLTACGAFMLVLPVLVGCSRNPATAARVSGTVKYNGSLVTGGTVIFHTQDGSQRFSCPIGPDGSYSQTDMPAGAMRVTVETESANKPPPPDYQKKMGRGPSGGEQKMSPIPDEFKNKQGGSYVKIPAKFADKDQS